MLHSHTGCDVTSIINREHGNRHLTTICYHQREILIEWRGVTWNPIADDNIGSHSNNKRTLRSSRKANTLNIVGKILLSTGHRILTGEVVALIYDAADDYFKVELIHQ